mmetsp:Transcript_46071/g.86221  ORF Transcript_46071/g.86221 Transcript_46071/m.86221 type:complete len:133 (+) Transcript_46071:59-457(+)
MTKRSRSRSPQKLDGEYTVQQKVNMRFLDAWEDEVNDFKACTREAQGNDSQVWMIKPTGGGYTIQQKINKRFLDAYEDDGNDYACCTRAAQGNDSQVWVVKATGGADYTIQQKNTMRFLDAHEKDKVVTGRS